jgi:hypothetical protein
MAADKSLHARIYLNHQGENMHEKQQKELLIKRILKYLPDAPDDAAQRLLQETVADLEHMLAAQSEKHAKQEAAERVSQHAAQMRRESQLVIMAERARTRSVHIPSKIKRPTPSFAYSWVTLR